MKQIRIMTQFNPHRFFSRFPNIELGSIKLRDLMLSDAERYLKLMSDPKVIEYLSDEDVPKNHQEAVQEIKFWGGLFYRKQSVFWAISEENTDNLIGTIGYNSWNLHNRRAEISYDLMSEYWRQGIMTRVLTNTLIFGFKEMSLYRIEARTMLDNIPSQKILDKLGFKKEGVLRGYRFIRGEPVDIVIYSILKKDFSNFLMG